MRIGQNRPLEKFTRFLFMRLNIACITNIYADTNLCDRHLTRIIRVNKTRAEKIVALRYASRPERATHN